MLRAENRGHNSPAYKDFTSQKWVYEYGVFRALKKANNGSCWNDWPEEDRIWPENRQKLSAEVEAEAQYQMFLQYIFYIQWMKVKKAANDAGIQIMGDVPFYVGQDSVDVWGGKDNFWFPFEVSDMVKNNGTVTIQKKNSALLINAYNTKTQQNETCMVIFQ